MAAGYGVQNSFSTIGNDGRHGISCSHRRALKQTHGLRAVFRVRNQIRAR